MPGLFAAFGALSRRSAPGDAAWRAGGVELAASGPARRVEHGPLVAVVDARLEQTDRLDRQLGLGPLGLGGGDRRAADARRLAAAVGRWGDAAPERLQGAFAAVVWDRDARRALVVRDRLGLRPLYRTAGGALAVASSLSDLGAHAAALDRGHLARFLAGAVDARSTAVDGVERVPPATVATVADGRWAERRFWQLDPGPTLVAGDAETEDRFRALFDAAVGEHLGDAPGAFLSGGLDSSSIVTTARALRPDVPVPTFSIVYDRAEADERRFLDAVLADDGLSSTRVDGERLSLLDGLDGDLRALGEPSLMPNLFLTRTLYAEARAAGLTAVLDGFAGDNVVGHGDLRLTELARALRLPTFVREVRAAARTTNRPRRAVLDFVRAYALAPLVRSRRPAAALTFAHPDLPAVPAPAPRPATDRAAHVAELTSPLLAHAFEVAYAVAAQHGIEPRFPFASAPLVAFCLALPPSQRMRDGTTRSILRRAMRGRLPETVRQRAGKARLGTSFEDALFVRDAARLRQLVYEDAAAAPDVLDVPALQAAYAQAARSPATRGALALPLWRAVAVARWLALRRAGDLAP